MATNSQSKEDLRWAYSLIWFIRNRALKSIAMTVLLYSRMVCWKQEARKMTTNYLDLSEQKQSALVQLTTLLPQRSNSVRKTTLRLLKSGILRLNPRLASLKPLASG